MTTFSMPVLVQIEDGNGNPTGATFTTMDVVVPDGVASFSYEFDPDDPQENSTDLAGIDVTVDAYQVTLGGEIITIGDVPGAADASFGAVNWNDNGTTKTTYVLGINPIGVSASYFVVVGGDQLPITDFASFQDFLSNLTSITLPGPNDDFGPGQSIAIPGITSEDDTFIADQGFDSVFGGAGNDSITLDHLDSQVYGGDGNDTIVAFMSAITVSGDDGDDVLELDLANAGASALDFNMANGVLTGIENGETITGSASNFESFNILSIGTDVTITGSTAANIIVTSDGDDSVFGAQGDDDISTGAGNDTITGWTGDDTMDGGAGIDTVDYSGFGSAITVSLLEAGAQTISAAGGVDTLSNFENVVASKASDTVLGNNQDNTITGLTGNDSLSGLGGDDIIIGGIQNDTLRGNNGNDTLIGGAGRDNMAGGAGADVFVFEEVSDSINGGFRDRILGFEQGDDLIDVSALADFEWLGTLRWGFADGPAARYLYAESTNKTIIYFDVDADNRPDSQIELIGNYMLTAADFIF